MTYRFVMCGFNPNPGRKFYRFGVVLEFVRLRRALHANSQAAAETSVRVSLTSLAAAAVRSLRDLPFYAFAYYMQCCCAVLHAVCSLKRSVGAGEIGDIETR